MWSIEILAEEMGVWALFPIQWDTEEAAREHRLWLIAQNPNVNNDNLRLIDPDGEVVEGPAREAVSADKPMPSTDLAEESA